MTRGSICSMRATSTPSWSATQNAPPTAPSVRASVGPSGQAFCAGANLMMVGMAGDAGPVGPGLDQTMIKGMQDVLKRAQYSSASRRHGSLSPSTLGGGLEVSMQTSAAHGRHGRGLHGPGRGRHGPAPRRRRLQGDAPALCSAAHPQGRQLRPEPLHPGRLPEHGPGQGLDLRRGGPGRCATCAPTDQGRRWTPIRMHGTRPSRSGPRPRRQAGYHAAAKPTTFKVPRPSAALGPIQMQLNELNHAGGHGHRTTTSRVGPQDRPRACAGGDVANGEHMGRRAAHPGPRARGLPEPARRPRRPRRASCTS